jgi:hypothetical protein
MLIDRAQADAHLYSIAREPAAGHPQGDKEGDRMGYTEGALR